MLDEVCPPLLRICFHEEVLAVKSGKKGVREDLQLNFFFFFFTQFYQSITQFHKCDPHQGFLVMIGRV